MASDTRGNGGALAPRTVLSRKSFGTSRRSEAVLLQPCSHLASPLSPGRGVLIRSVSRRLGSVACVRDDASPNEVSSVDQAQHARWYSAVSNPSGTQAGRVAN